ncbi:DNA polymerase domain-containing protein [Peribacillus glennii]|uniref:DNA polymerase domain-containing protein n=2 Tax=Peribacillus glennii TaxID=2303991 RepID=A0A372LK78_9BACI|nr:DNA polymerase domain-containing protein [Peribacillus glennii]
MIWADLGIRKLDYLLYLAEISQSLLRHSQDRLLMMWVYPHGIKGKRIEKRSLPSSAPLWIPSTFYKEKQRMLLNDTATLIWAADYGALEFHVPFDSVKKEHYPLELAFDLDPPNDESFELVLEVAFELKRVLDSLGLQAIPRTSGSTGMQIFVPIAPIYTFEQARKMNTFIANYFLEKLPGKITLERVVSKRGKKLYFDYLQLWKGRTMPAVYSARAKPNATVAAPVTWEEVQKGFLPIDFTILNMKKRIEQKGDLFSVITSEKHTQNLDEILSFIEKAL